MDSSDEKVILLRRQRQRGLCLILFLGLVLCFWQLGSTGLVDETPPKFAAAGRAMSITGDWLTPRANGIPRFDKPPLLYWLMGMVYSSPGQELWDPLGSWAARFPSALSSVLVMLFLGDTVMRWPQKAETFPRRTGVIAALAFSLSPLVLIWSRIAVSDALLCCTFGVSMLLQWRRYVNPTRFSWVYAWIALALAVLTKGPVAIVLMGMTLVLFAWTQEDFALLWNRLRPIPGLLITACISLPWYLMELLKEGQPFWDSFFGYHNFQRFTSVVNSHQQPWWFFGLIFIIASLPFTPLLILGMGKAFKIIGQKVKSAEKQPENSLLVFAACWLLCILVFFTCAGTKLPSYWLPATPAAAILIAFSESYTRKHKRRQVFLFAWWVSIILVLLIAFFMWSSIFWDQFGLTQYINDPEIPGFAESLISSGILIRAATCFSLSACLGIVLIFRPRPGGLLALQAPLAVFHLVVLLPLFGLVDELRQLPLRQVSNLLLASQKPDESILMVGVSKPSIHFYTKQVILYEGNTARNLVNLTDRLGIEKRLGWSGKLIDRTKRNNTALVVIDNKTSQLPHWRGLDPVLLGQFGIYKVWRLNRRILERRAIELIVGGVKPNWRLPKPEWF
ncbi:glycosyltransferase family 39 protein [Prochlorococcus sp. MIT 1307]|uniref:ArnT family glycosyltransferase n=1 Tax=Prochlorococcus sp. MIT 1307 TaxID=3096219 RepID=UPI002A751671|nr:glycosyltransferase family 39 protein [Prochlorococcus sp. MIT 1307]